MCIHIISYEIHVVSHRIFMTVERREAKNIYIPYLHRDIESFNVHSLPACLSLTYF